VQGLAGGQASWHRASRQTPRRISLPRLATRLPQDDHRLGSLALPRHPIGHSGRDVVREYQPVRHRLRLSASP